MKQAASRSTYFGSLISRQPKHVTISLFEAIETTSQTLAKILTKLLDKYGLRKKIIVYM
jgi:hypothetical protein